jgi:murein DD-endopeptidase MepM/ murein hydrolase activator NlpD
MNKTIKIWYHSGVTSDIREFSIHKLTLLLMFIATISVITAASYVGVDYLRLKKRSFDTVTLNQEIDSLNHEVKTQRSHIQQFAGEIENLKNKLVSLSEFEDKVRLIADIKQISDSSGLIGIGGIPSDELDPDIPLEQKQNNLIREMHKQVAQTTLASQKQALDFEHLIKLLERKRNLLASTPSIRPVNGWVTSGFGNRVSPFTGQKEFHAGIDISNTLGTEVLATANGRVSHAAGKMYIGNLVVIDHGYGRVSKYGHLKKILVKQGQEVKRGDVIALLGNTGRSTGPHVHYEVRINGTPVNPLKFILN